MTLLLTVSMTASDSDLVMISFDVFFSEANMYLCIVLQGSLFQLDYKQAYLFAFDVQRESRHPYFFRSTYVPAGGGIGVCMSPTYEILTTYRIAPRYILSRSSVKSLLVDGYVDGLMCLQVGPDGGGLVKAEARS